MSYKTRSVRRIARKTKRKLLFNFIVVLFILYATLRWILPVVVGGAGSISDNFKKPLPVQKSISEEAQLAPPVLFIPFEATNSASIDVKGYATGNSKVKIFVNNILTNTLDVSGDGNFKISGVDLVTGNNYIYGKTIDDKGKESLPSKTVTVSLNNEKPALKVTEPNDKKTVDGDAKINVSGNVSSDAQVFVNGNHVITNPEGNFTTTITLNSGDNTINIKAVDKATNSVEENRTVTYQPSSPSPTPSP